MSALTVIQRLCQLHALAVPQSVVGGTETQTTQLLAMLNEVLEDIVVESKYQVVTREAVHMLSAGENQGPVSSLGGGLIGYYQANFETFYDRTLGRPLYGPLNDTEWQEIKALPNPGPFYKFRIMGDCLLINPAPADPFSTISFEYMSTYVVAAADGTPKANVTLDTDVFLLPENIIRKFLIARWKHVKGLPYAEDKSKAYELLNGYIARDKAKRRINVSCSSPTDIAPGVFVPSGNWMQ